MEGTITGCQQPPFKCRRRTQLVHWTNGNACIDEILSVEWIVEEQQNRIRRMKNIRPDKQEISKESEKQ